MFCWVSLALLSEDRRFLERAAFNGLGVKVNGVHVFTPGRFPRCDNYSCNDKACRRLLVSFETVGR